jgi:predicted hydrocarbon binding protein
MREVKIDQAALIKIRELYESVMASACHGLFAREGAILGAEIATQALKDPERYFTLATEAMVGLGWVESVEFRSDRVVVKGSIEAAEGQGVSCHRLRGMLRELYERKSSTRVNCLEEECVGNGNDACVFRIQAA